MSAMHFTVRQCGVYLLRKRLRPRGQSLARLVEHLLIGQNFTEFVRNRGNDRLINRDLSGDDDLVVSLKF